MNHLFLELKGASFDDAAGRLSGYANVKGNTDRVGDIVAENAYIELDDAVKDGFGAHSHEWKFDEQVATLEDLREDASGLYFSWHFHTTDTAQKCRTIVRERIDRNKKVFLSIGYQVVESHVEKDVRILTKIRIFEVSLVTVPANPLAVVTGFKGGKVDMPLEDHTLCMVDALEQWVGRLKARSDDRVKAGRTLSGSTRECMSRACEAMMEAHARLSELMESTDKPKEIDQELAALQIAALTRQAARRGMAL